MSMNSELKVIKKKYGEGMMHFCRKSFPTILIQNNVLLNILLNNFSPDRDLYSDIERLGIENEFINYINSLYNPEYIKKIETCSMSPKEIFDKLGYDFYECQNNEDILSFKKYYAPDEELCSFNEDRISRCFVFFAVRKDIKEIKRKDFLFPQRQDKYGVSCLSIQFSRDSSHILSIKNRYNHIVDGADATFNNNLENIYPGLTDAFAKTYGLSEKQPKTSNFKIDGYVKANNGKFYKYNYMISNIYYWNNNIIVDNGIVKEFEHEKYLVVDIYIIDLVKKEIYIYDKNLFDSFPKLFEGIEDIKIKNVPDGKEVIIYLKDNTYFYLKLDRNNNIIELKNEFIKCLPDYFMFFSKKLEKLLLPQLVEIQNNVLWSNIELSELDIRNVEIIGEYFLGNNEKLKKIDIDKVKSIGNGFLRNNIILEEIFVSSLVSVKEYFLSANKFLKRLSCPNLEYINNNFLNSNVILEEINIPKVQEIKRYFLYLNKGLKRIDLFELSYAGSFFLINNLRVVVNAPNLIFVEDVDNPCLNKYIEKINNEHTLELLELCEETNHC